MGEVLFGRRVLVLFLVISFVFVFSVGVFAAHPLYPSFSSPISSFGFDNVSNVVSAGDSAVYNVGYYSINGFAWQSFNLSGNVYSNANNTNWLNGTTSYTLPSFGVGEHYIIIYSCTYNTSNNSWNCHDNKWQLIIVNNSASCTTHASSTCYSGDVYWYNSCSAREGIRYDCNSSQTCSNSQCVNNPTGTCGGSTCAAGEYCSNGACLLNVSGHTYFVATNGNDNWPGTFSQPWKTWQKGFETAEAGDIVYFRGGVYELNTRMFLSDHNGNPGNYIRYFAYPSDYAAGNYPILDCINKTGGGEALLMMDCNYLYFKGLTIRNNHDGSRLDKSAWALQFGGNVVFDQCVAYNNDCRGFYMTSYSSVTLINCDSYNNVDPVDGNHGEGFVFIRDNTWDAHPTYSANITGCRAWGNSDSGFGSNYGDVEIYDNCWSFDNGRVAGEGAGWKYLPSTWLGAGVNGRILKNCIAAHNGYGTTSKDVASGFDENGADGTLCDYQISNCFSYDNYLAGFRTIGGVDYGTTRLIRNCISYSNAKDVELNNGNPPIFSNNSWQFPSITVSAADFLSLDYNQLRAPRKADGSLPDVTFGHLAPGSDLIDAGVYIPGYHCATAGAHPDENCVAWYGSAPDLGAFEYINSTANQTEFYFALPSTGLSLLVGQQITIYGYSLIDFPPDNLTVDYACNIGTESGNDYTINPVTADTGNHILTIVFKNNGETFLTKIINIYVFPKKTAGSYKILPIGDSTLEGPLSTGKIESTLSPVTITWLGTQGTTRKFEGRVGWTFEKFATDASSPFRKNGVINISAYFTDNSIAAPDIVYIRLGVNDVSQYYLSGITDRNIETILGYSDNLIDAFLAYNANLTIIIALPTICTSNLSKWQASNPGTTPTIYVASMHHFWADLAAKYANGAYNARVEMSYEAINLNMATGYQDDVHPNAIGAGMLADGLSGYLNRLP